ncbi:hypothetical protein ACFVFJ_37330 [Streptomyces sp. NPDC057717]|uniref:hypothetical protein n=1 Tax=unclassified Streptomyces TaxID=2593676 RepID=UPI00362F8F1E
MGDFYELQLALDLPDSADLGLLRWHLGETPEDKEPDGDEEYPLLTGTGPAQRIGGALVGMLQRGPRGCSLLARQEVHPDDFARLRHLLKWIAARTTTVGAIGYVRFYEDHIPDVLVVESGTVRQVPLELAPRAGELLPD